MSIQARLRIEADESERGLDFMDDPDLIDETKLQIEMLREAADTIDTLAKRLRHSEWHRTANRRRMRKLGKYQGVLEAKIVRQREALREFARPRKKLDAHARASDLHHSLRSEP